LLLIIPTNDIFPLYDIALLTNCSNYISNYQNIKEKTGNHIE